MTRMIHHYYRRPPPLLRVVAAASRRQFHTSSPRWNGGNGTGGVTLGILRESYNVWERRTPLCPSHISTLLGHPSVDAIIVQPSSSRIFSNVEYEMAGATVSDNMDNADLILGVKRPLLESSLQANKSYMMFSHVIKGQPENMALLQYILDNDIQLFDYECIVTQQQQQDDGSTAQSTKPRRLVAFGKFAGRAGMADAFNPLGRRLLAMGFSTPFLHVPPAHMQDDWTTIQTSVKHCGDRIAVDGLPPTMEPVVICMTGKGGNVHSGVMEVFNLLPHKMVSVDELPDVVTSQVGSSQHCIYGLSVGPDDVFQRIGSDSVFDRDDYQTRPQEYESTFSNRIAPYIHVLVNGMYWDLRFPRLFTKDQMQQLYMDGNKRLMLVVDISCDVNGSIEFLERTTDIDRPYFQYDPIVQTAISESISSDGVTVMGVDILPTELPRESSTFFGDALLPVLEKYIDSIASGEATSEHQPSGPSELTNACIASGGSLTPSFRHLESFLKRPSGKVPPAESKATIWMEGHLFDSGFINHALDIIEQNDCTFEIVECNVRRKLDGTARKSNVIIRIAAEDDQRIERIEEQICSLMNIMENAEASFKRLDDGSSSTGKVDASQHPTATATELPKQEKILVLGSGLVSKSLVEYLGREDRRRVTVAGAIDEEARSVCKAAKNGRHVALDVRNEMDKVAELVEESDIVVSLLPAPMHPVIAEACIDKSTDLVTASYESEAMRQLDERAKANGVRVLNEVGLDPGLDHMSAMKMIDDIHDRGGIVKGFISVCGGLPSPEAADNPLMYKFSWSPMGVLSACKNSATYRRHNEIRKIDGNQLLRSAAPFSGAWPALKLECLPNRNSLLYGTKYCIPHAEDLFRGTLRFGGFSGIMSVFQTMGLLEAVDVDGGVLWSGVLDNLRNRAGFETFDDYLLYCAGGDAENASRAAECLDFLGLEGSSPLAYPDNLVASFCEVLKSKCRYEEGERDMCLMHTSIRAVFDDEVEERHQSSLQVFGDSAHSAMSKTVGYTAAAAADLLLTDSSVASAGGLLLPISKEIYLPILDALANEGVEFKEEVKVDTDLSFKPQSTVVEE